VRREPHPIFIGREAGQNWVAARRGGKALKMRHAAFFFCVAVLCASAPASRAEQPGPFGEAKGAMRQQDHRVPLSPAVTGGGFMIVTIYRPTGEARHPVIILSHGSPGPRNGTRAAYQRPTEWFVGMGFVVVMLNRRGHGLTGGKRPDLVDACAANPELHAAGLETSKDFEAALLYLQGLPYARADHVIAVGQSTGGWAAIATASRNLPGLRAAINFAGGRSSGARCPLDAVRTEAMGRYGGAARIPTLWVYTENDKSFGPALSRAMAEFFRAAGGDVDYRLLPPFGEDGHRLFGANTAVSLWSPHVLDFFEKKSLLPTR